MNISIGIMAYNDGSNIENLLKSLLSQKTKNVKIKEIIIVSSGSTDKTNSIVKNYTKKNKKIKLIIQNKREGKASAINIFLKTVKEKILVLESADTIPKEDAIEKLCLPLKNKKNGIVASHPVPKNNKKDFLGFLINLEWKLHHKISLLKPKFGELIAFRKLFRKIENTAVDEEYIAMLIKNKNLKGYYASNAIVYNTGPKTISDFIKQRRRIYCGHIELKKKNNYKTSTIDNFNAFRILLKEINLKNIFPIIFTVFLEGYGRFLGVYDYYTNKKHYIWEIVR